MNIKITKNPEVIFSLKTLTVIAIAFLSYLLVNFIYLRWISYADIQKSLKNTNDRIISDLVYQNNKLDISGYVNDDQTTQDNPLYIFTTDGFVIDRIKPIGGFLDTSDFKYSSSFQTPQTITSPANETWRIYSKPITRDQTVLGIVVVGYYQPEVTSIKDVDDQLLAEANNLVSEIKLNGDNLDVTGIDIKKINVKLVIEVIDRFNHVISSVGTGLPAYIDRSYLADQTHEEFKTVNDQKTGEQFLIYSKPKFDSSKNLIGVVVSGYSLRQVSRDLRNQLIFSIVSGGLITLLVILTTAYLLRDQLAKTAKRINESLLQAMSGSQGQQLSFDKDKSAIYFKSEEFKIPYGTLQYEICKLLFSNARKRWEYDEILDGIGEENLNVRENWRRIYDAVRTLNEKSTQELGFNVILFEYKTFRVNNQIPQSSLNPT